MRPNGFPFPLLVNGKIAVANDPIFSHAIMLDEFSQEILLTRPMPWDQYGTLPRVWQDTDDIELAIWFQGFMLHLGPNQTKEVIIAFAKDNSFHPVMEFFESLRWDGVPRLGDRNNPSWLTYYCGAKDDEFARAVGARWMISGVARIFQPGCQADSVLILEGRTGLGKSSVFKILGGAWYTNHIAALSTDDASEQILGRHVIELDELDAMQRVGEWPAVLSFISRSTDRFRLKYARRSGIFPRQCIFGGTTEREEWLRDYAGHRRWWPIACGSHIDLVALENDRDQLWAEAVVRYKAGEQWWLHETPLIGLAAEATGERMESDTWEPRIRQYLSIRRTTTITEILEDIGVKLDRQTEREKKRVARVLRRLKWIRAASSISANNVWQPEPV